MYLSIKLYTLIIMLFVSFYSFANQRFLKHQKESYYVKNRCDILM